MIYTFQWVHEKVIQFGYMIFKFSPDLNFLKQVSIKPYSQDQVLVSISICFSLLIEVSEKFIIYVYLTMSHDQS